MAQSQSGQEGTHPPDVLRSSRRLACAGDRASGPGPFSHGLHGRELPFVFKQLAALPIGNGPPRVAQGLGLSVASARPAATGNLKLI